MSNNDDIEKRLEQVFGDGGDDNKDNNNEAKVVSLGKAKMFDVNDNSNVSNDIGYKRVPVEVLPSKGLFYPDGTEIGIRSATVAEIKHWSTIDDNDLLSIDECINFVLERCVRIKMPNRISSWLDIKELDRIYLIFAIRELTFKNGENKLYVDTGDGDKVEVTKDMLNYFNIDDRLLKYYNNEKRCFTLRFKDGSGDINIYMPSIGVSNFLKNYIKTKNQANQKFDQVYARYAPFLYDDYRVITTQKYEKDAQDSYFWDLKKISLLSQVVDILQKSIDMKVKYKNKEGAELEAQLNFRGGFKSIFVISDIFDELV